jgi:RpiR family transcriptional regulator, carbohydrate utilization regulator
VQHDPAGTAQDAGTAPSNLVDVIARAIPRLRPSERKVAETILENPHAYLRASLATLAHAAGVSEPTIVRFCARIGFPRFAAFRLQLAQSLALGIPATQSSILAGDSVGAVTEKIFDFALTSLDHARRALDVASLERAVDLLAAAKEILFLGFGASGIVAQDAQQKFPLFGAPCHAPADAHQQFIAVSLAGAGTVVVAISNTGRTASLLDAVAIARENGATTIGISGERRFLLEAVDVPLVVETLENTDVYTPTISRLAQLAVVDILATGVTLRHDPDSIERLRRMKAGLTAMRTRDLQPREEQQWR